MRAPPPGREGWSGEGRERARNRKKGGRGMPSPDGRRSSTGRPRPREESFRGDRLVAGVPAAGAGRSARGTVASRGYRPVGARGLRSAGSRGEQAPQAEVEPLDRRRPGPVRAHHGESEEGPRGGRSGTPGALGPPGHGSLGDLPASADLRPAGSPADGLLLPARRGREGGTRPAMDGRAWATRSPGGLLTRPHRLSLPGPGHLGGLLRVPLETAMA